MADTTQIVTLINQIALLGAEYIPVAVALARQWSASAGQPVSALLADSDAQVDATVADVLADETALGFPAQQTS